MLSTDPDIELTPMNKTTNSFPIPTVLLAIFCLGISGFCFLMVSDFYHDDAMISLRYAYNWLAGDGLTWNAGEYVEGYTNFLYVVAIALLGYLGVDLRIASQFLGVSSYLVMTGVLVVYMWSYERRQPNSSFAFKACCLLLFSSISLAAWSVSGLEAVMVSAWVAGAVVCYLVYLESSENSYLLLSSLLFVFASLARLDAGIFPAISGCFLLGLWIKGKVPFKQVLIFAAPALIYLPYLFWKWHYYGDILPNTFYVKAGSLSVAKFSFGFAYLLMFIFSPPFLYLWIAALGFRYRDRVDQKVQYLFVLLISHALYIVYAGGDHMPVFRFFVPILPAAYLACYFLLRTPAPQAENQTSMLARSALFLSIVLQFVWPIYLVTPFALPAKEDPAAYIGGVVGKYIESNWPEGSLIAINTAGSTAYYAPRHRFIDMLGLNDAHIARTELKIQRQLRGQKLPGHNKGDGAYVLERKPDYIIIGPAEGVVAKEAWFLSGYELSKLAAFHQRYEKRTVLLDVPDKKSDDFYNAVDDGQIKFIYYQRAAP